VPVTVSMSSSQHIVSVTVSMSSSHAVNCASSRSKFLHQYSLTIRVSSADSTSWSLRTTQPFVVSADVGVNSTVTASMRICARLKWFVTRQHHLASLSLSTATTQRCDHCSTFTLQSEPFVSELLELLLIGMTRIVGVRRKKPVVLRTVPSQ